MVSRLVIFSTIVGLACAATWFGKPPTKPREFAHKEGCYIKEINDVVPYGTTLRPLGYCYRIHCSSGMIDYASCGKVGTDDQNCHVTDEDLSKPHPECCPTIRCDIDNNLV